MDLFNSTRIDYHNASEKSLVDACKSGQYPIIGGCEFGRHVVLIENDAVIKYGYGVTAAEAATQAYVHSHVDISIFRVPKVYRFFEEESDLGSIGYLVMEFIEGTTLDDLDIHIKSGLSTRIASYLRHLWQIPIPANTPPGPIGGGEPRGHIWSDEGACTVFETILDMDNWLNVSLDIDEDMARMGRWDILDYRAPLESIHHRLSLANCSLVLCHGDFIGRNAILQPDGTICILDWGCAGCYPLFFDLYLVISNESSDPALLTPLLQQLSCLRTKFAKELDLLRRVQRANTVFSRAPKDEQKQWSFDSLEPFPEPYWPERVDTV
ncbi:hypothetical protein MMC11_002400 [Xylographa trunciseda]|nr:hypothetical protein [Xylographa trunciseda]